MSYKIWSDTELEQLTKLYPKGSIKELENLFGRSWELIKARARKIPVYRAPTIECCPEQLIIADYLLLKDRKQVQKKYKISVSMLYKILAKNKVELLRPSIIIPVTDVEFTKDYNTSRILDMAEKYKVTEWGIRNKVKQLKLGVSPFRQKRKPTFTIEQLADIKQKYTVDKILLKDIANQYAVNLSVIFSVIQNNNWSLPKEEIKLRRMVGMAKGKELNPGCYGKTQKSIGDWLKTSTNLDFISDRIILEGKEIDLYNDNVKTGIEYCGLYWHNEHSHQPKLQNYHYDKYIKAKEKGVHLITIFEDEWLNRNEQVKGALLSILGKNTRRLYARKCNVKLIDKLTGNKFYNDYHIQGQSNLSKWFAGLYYEDELIGVLSFGLHHRDTSKYTLDRLCFKTNVSVAGGTSKLFKFLIEQSKLTNLISWSDNRWFQGKVYEKLGFVKEMDMKPDYSYVDNNKLGIRLSKQSQKKSNTKCPSNLTEKEWCTQRGLYRIWDCGKTRWIWSR
jgi:hypothetical protein